MEPLLKTTGFLLIFLSLIHIYFPKYFQWKSELKSLSLINAQMMYVHTFFIGFIVLLMGLLCISSTHDLVSTNLGRQICLGFAIFWGVRLYFQFFVYSSKLWKCKIFETTVHIIFSLLWIYLTGLFFAIFSGHDFLISA